MVFFSNSGALSTRCETAQTRKRDHPRHQKMEATRVDGVKASLHNGTPHQYLHKILLLGLLASGGGLGS